MRKSNAYIILNKVLLTIFPPAVRVTRALMGTKATPTASLSIRSAFL